MMSGENDNHLNSTCPLHLSVWDHRQLMARVRFREDRLHQLLALYLDSAAGQMQSLREAVAGMEFTAIANQAHSMKGSSANLGAERFSAHCHQLELAGRAQDPVAVKHWWPKTENTMDQLLQTLAEWMARQTDSSLPQ